MKPISILTVALALLAIGAITARADITIQDLDLQGVDYSSSTGPSATATYIATSPTTGYAEITSPDNVSGGIPQIEDTGLVVVNNGYHGVSLGTLGYLVAQGAAGHVSFNLLSEGGENGLSTNGQYAYWDVLLTDPNDITNKILINAYSNNQLGANPFNQGVAGNSSVDASTSLPGGNGSLFPFGSTWSTVGMVVVDLNELSAWNVASVSIGVGGWGTGIEGIADIGSVTLPGNAVPEPSMWALMFGGMATLLVISRRRALLSVNS